MKKKRTTKRRKMSTGGKIAIGVAVLGGAYLGWEYLIKPMINKDKPEEPKTPQETEQQVQAVVDNVQQLPANQAPATKNRLNPIGSKRFDMDARTFYGDKGAEVEFIQSYVNKIRQVIGGLKQRGLTNAIIPEKLDVDGVYGKKTLKALEDLKLTGQGGVNGNMIVKKKQEWDKIYRDLLINYTQSAMNSQNTGSGSILQGAQL